MVINIKQRNIFQGGILKCGTSIISDNWVWNLFSLALGANFRPLFSIFIPSGLKCTALRLKIPRGGLTSVFFCFLFALHTPLLALLCPCFFFCCNLARQKCSICYKIKLTPHHYSFYLDFSSSFCFVMCSVFPSSIKYP